MHAATAWHGIWTSRVLPLVSKRRTQVPNSQPDIEPCTSRVASNPRHHHHAGEVGGAPLLGPAPAFPCGDDDETPETRIPRRGRRCTIAYVLATGAHGLFLFPHANIPACGHLLWFWAPACNEPAVCASGEGRSKTHTNALLRRMLRANAAGRHLILIATAGPKIQGSWWAIPCSVFELRVSCLETGLLSTPNTSTATSLPQPRKHHVFPG